MNQEQHAVPLRKTSAGEQIETRPLYVEEWLDSLPYIDFKKTSRLLYDATKATNQQNLKAGTRIELVQLYNRPYQYYLDSQIKTGAQHTLQSIDNMQQQIEVLKLIAVNLGFACKLAVEDALKRKTLWGNSKPPLAEMLMSMNYLSHALIFSFLEYAPVPRNVWRELHFIYDFADSIKRANNELVIPGNNARKGPNTITNAYKRILLASLADPYHLPFGAIWEIFEQLGGWCEHTELRIFDKPPDDSGYFVVNLDSDNAPVSLTKFDPKLISKQHRLLDTNALGTITRKHLSELKSGKPQTGQIQLSPYYAKAILNHVVKAWSLPAKRDSDRQTGQGIMFLTCGVNAAYYFFNGEEEFIAPAATSGSHGEAGTETDIDITPKVNYMVDSWNLVDQGRGGFAVIRNDKPQYTVRVGDLVAMGLSDNEMKKPATWMLGVIRWLMVKQSKVYKVGIQTIPGNIRTGAIRARSGSDLDSRFRRAFILSQPAQPGKNSVIVSKGLYIEQRDMELHFKNQTFPVIADNLLESSMAFEHFTINKK